MTTEAVAQGFVVVPALFGGCLPPKSACLLRSSVADQGGPEGGPLQEMGHHCGGLAWQCGRHGASCGPALPTGLAGEQCLFSCVPPWPTTAVPKAGLCRKWATIAAAWAGSAVVIGLRVALHCPPALPVSSACSPAFLRGRPRRSQRRAFAGNGPPLRRLAARPSRHQGTSCGPALLTGPAGGQCLSSCVFPWPTTAVPKTDPCRMLATTAAACGPLVASCGPAPVTGSR